MNDRSLRRAVALSNAEWGTIGTAGGLGLRMAGPWGGVALSAVALVTILVLHGIGSDRYDANQSWSR
ncbi:MAG: hypothetical protein IT536_05315 [Hyphomicrobiales bacterium]|nr:hypothetical protein [Hyphomicrobiales bacterium]